MPKNPLFVSGGNDLKILRVDPGLAPALLNTSLSNIREIIRRTKRISDKTYILTIPPIYTVPFYLKPFPFTRAMLSALKTLNAGIGEVAEDEGVTVIDCAREFRGMTRQEILAADNIHLSEQAYEALFSEIHAD